MTSRELRRRFLDFFKKKGHQIVTSSSLLPADPSVLFTTAGMQQFKEYYLEKSSPFGENVATCQKCFRTSDIEEVGDESHLTFLEMLGNFSFGGYFKEEAIKLAYEFLFKELKLLKEEAIFTVFEGDNDVPADEESVLIWKKLGVPKSQIKKCGRDDNFWGPTGEEGPCGPTSEIHLKGTEIWNLVFNEYYQDKDKKLTFLKQKGVDTGMGLERLAMIVQKKNSVFETDLFEPVIKEIPGDFQKARRIIADHVKASVFLISEDILPSNVERGYVLRRVLRRAIRYGKLLNLPKNFLMSLAKKAVDIYKDVYPELKSKEADILTAIQNEEEKFEKTLETGLKELKSQILNVKSREFKVLSGKIIFDLYQSYGFPLDLTRELAREEELDIDEAGFKEEFEKHQEISRAGMEKKFKGGLAGTEKQVIKYHTATHLLLAALREILGQEIYQKGSNITEERLRFDFNYPEKLSEKQLKLIEDLVNEKIRDDIRVEMMELPKSEALKIAKVSFDPSKYGESVKVYKIGDFSIELCGGPHVDKTSELGQFKIVKEESSGAGVRRIRAVLIP
jgi:alanyl-tRNA synthetase